MYQLYNSFGGIHIHFSFTLFEVVFTGISTIGDKELCYIGCGRIA
jgi:hypothetical protein